MSLTIKVPLKRPRLNSIRVTSLQNQTANLPATS